MNSEKKNSVVLGPYELSKIREIAHKIDNSNRRDLSNELMDILLSSDRPIPGTTARVVFRLWQTGKLDTNAGLEKLLESGLSVNIHDTFKILDKYEESEIKEKIKKVLEL